MFDIAICGCGPGGLASALFLTRLGHRVTLFERFDTPQPVGSGLLVQPSGLAILDALGLGDTIRAQGARVDYLHGTDIVSGKRALDVRYGALKALGPAYGVHRSLLFTALFDAVRASGAAIETGRTVTGAEALSASRVGLVFADGSRSPGFDLVVDALGTRTTLAPRCGHMLGYGAFWATLDWPEGAGFRADALDQRYRRAREMAGVMPIGVNPATGRQGAAFFWSLRGEAVDAFHARGFGVWRDEALALWPETESLLAQIADTRDLVFARYAHRTLGKPIAGQLVHLGDAWHSTSPQLGQGANMALLDAAALGTAIGRHADIGAALADYRWLRSAHVRLYQAMSLFLTPLYQASDGVRPFLRDQLVHYFAGLPGARQLVAAIVSGGIGWPLRPMGIERAR